MTLRHRIALLAVAAAAATAGPAGDALAQAWPNRTVTIVVAYPPGGVADQMARVMASELGRRVGRNVVVENRAGASGTIGANHVAKAAPDGHTLLMGAMAEIVFTPSMRDDMPYRPERDLSPIAQVVQYPFMLVTHPSFPGRTTRELIELAKARPGAYTYATGGTGSVQHIAMEMFARTVGIELRHIPYKGVAPALADVLGDQVSMMFAGFPPAMAQVRAGKLNAIGLTTRERLAVAPDIPSVSETPGLSQYDFPVWVALFAPSGTPAAVLDRLHRESAEIFSKPDVRGEIEKAGMTASSRTRADFAAFLAQEHVKYRKIIRDAGIKEN